MKRWWVMALCAAAMAGAQAQDVELYDQPRFTGMRLTIGQDTPDLAPYGIGGRVASVVVKRGQWEFCTQPGFGGVCIAVGPGRYAELPPGFRGTLASVRNATGSMTGAQTGTTQPFPVPGAPPPVVAASNEAITLYLNADYSGNKVAMSSANPRLSNLDFNDAALSVEIVRGRWQLCEHADYFGQCQVFGPGRHQLSGKLARGVSSLRPVIGSDNRPMPASGAIVLYEHGDYQGRELALTAASGNLSNQGFNDMVSSVDVLGGRWELCTDNEYGGRCVTFGVGRHNIERAMNDRITSVRPR